MPQPSSKPLNVPARLVIAIGGNATHPENITGTSDEQKDIAKLDRAGAAAARDCRTPS